MPIITIGQTKGGVGKTTLAINIAAMLARTGSVLVIDGDRQKTISSALVARSDHDVPPVTVAAYPDGPELRSQVLQLQKRFDFVVIDAGGRDSTALRAALALSDLLISPFQPRSFDVWGMSDIAALIDEARSVRDGLKAVAVLNGADPSASSDNAEAAELVASMPQFAYLDCPIRRRKSISTAATDGLSVTEKGKDKKAREEVERMFNMILEVMNNGH